MIKRRIDIVLEGGKWTVAAGGPSWRGHATKRAATEAARKLTQAYESDGDGVEIYVWEGSAATCIYPEEGSLSSEEKDR